MLQQETAEDFVIATDETNTLADFIEEAFLSVGLNWHDHVVSDQSLLRPSEIMVSRGNADKAAEQLGWKAQYRMRDVVRMMTQAERTLSTKPA
jgi:GDPmannose 4,6-dehydratase